MADNLDFGPDAQGNHALALLRGLDRSGPVQSGEALVPGLWLDTDPEARIEGGYETRPGHLLDLRFEVQGPARWLALHLDLGSPDLAGRQVLGLVARSAAPETVTVRPCLRSGGEAGFVDTFFPKRMVSVLRPSVHADLMRLGEEPGAPPAVAPWRQLVLFFEGRSFEISLLDLRLFIV